jgi:hypothetical protein
MRASQQLRAGPFGSWGYHFRETTSFRAMISRACSATSFLSLLFSVSKDLSRYTVRELLQEMETLTKVKYSGKYGHILTEVTKPQREILQGLNIALPG